LSAVGGSAAEPAVLVLGTLRVRGGSSAVGCSGRWGPGCWWA